MASQPKPRSVGTYSWRLENVRLCLGFSSQGDFQKWLGKGFAGSGYGEFLKIGEKRERGEREERKMQARMRNLDDRLPFNLGDYVRHGGENPNPELPDDFDVDAFQEKADKELRAREEQKKMGDEFDEVTKLDEYRNAESGENVNVLRMLHDAVKMFQCSLRDAERYVASALVGMGRKDVADVLLDRSLRRERDDVQYVAAEDVAGRDYERRARLDRNGELPAREGRKALGSGGGTMDGGGLDDGGIKKIAKEG